MTRPLTPEERAALISETRSKRDDERMPTPRLRAWLRATLIQVWSAPDKGRDPDEIRAIVDEEWPDAHV